MSRATQIERIIAKGQLVPLLFSQAAVAVSQTAAALTVVETSADTIEVVMPFDFEIIALSTSVSEARTAGTLTTDATIDTAVTGLQNVINATDTLRDYATQPRGSDVGVAGSRVGVKLTTDASWAPITGDVAVILWVLLHLEGI